MAKTNGTSAAASVFLMEGAPSIKSAFESYASHVKANAADSLSPKLRAMIGVVIGLIIPSKPLVNAYLEEAGKLATKPEIAESVMAAAALRAGGAIGYGRLAFKLIENRQFHEPEGNRSQIQQDREYMTHLRKANPGSFDRLLSFMAALHQPQLVLPAKHYELMAVAGATITQCVYCLEKHVNDAKKVGASDREIADVVHMAVVLRAESVMHDCENERLIELLMNFSE